MSKSTLEYLKTIYLLSKKNEKVRVTDIATELKCSKPSVTKQLNILKENKMINYEAYSNIVLTELGRETANKMMEEYEYLYLLLHNIIGIEKNDSFSEAKKLKGIISDKSLNKIVKYVYKTLGLKEENCDFDITNDKCRNCFNKLRKDELNEEFIEN